MSHGRGYRRGSGFKGQRQNYNKNNKKEDEVAVDEDNPIISCFRQYSLELDEKHDRYERIVKLSRDITIESKRIIFLLHTHDIKKDNHQAVTDEAKTRLLKLCSSNFAGIAKEMHGLDPYQYSRAYSAGLQEFIEAYTFYEYVSGDKISHWKSIQEKMVYNVKKVAEVAVDAGGEVKVEAEGDDNKEVKEEAREETIVNDEETEVQECFIQPTEYMLGLGDLSGEIMRRCINSLGSGDVDTCFNLCRFMQELYKGFIGITAARSKDMSQKIYTLRQSLIKTENVCYNVKVRGGEAAKWGTDDSSANYGNLHKDSLDDEGVFF